MKRLYRGVTLIEVLVAAGLFAMIMTAILSFYIEAAAVSAKRDEQSARLRRFHLGLDKIEQTLREGRIMTSGSRLLTIMKLADVPEANGFPNYEPIPIQFVCTREGVMQLRNTEQPLNILPLEPEETVYFGWVQYNPPHAPNKDCLRITLRRHATDQHSEMVFSRTIPLFTY